ncbi:hypothetical protein D9615_004236 [Tricholomella constricta]|uniref:J domain-containing protein n=1 Tax=Tricholomella constricta TaxID=117010 RepID=A0A8H5HEV2_9AGAR|nr:hypothetical protein D9615_004236 [Tricholomella constricta]
MMLADARRRAALNSTAMSPMKPIPITVFTGFLGAGKTSVILSLLPQLPKDYKVVLLKNEFGDVEVDSKLAQQSSLTAVSEILNGCVCCVLVGQMQTAILEIRDKFRPDRIIIECSGSAFPATLAFQIREVERETQGDLKLDAIVTVVDAENFAGYEDTSPTAKMQSSYTDIILINKWEHVSQRDLDLVLDHLHTLNDLTPKIRCDGRNGVDPNLIFGLETRLFLDKANHLHTDATPSHNDEVQTITLYRGSSKGRPHSHTDGNCDGCASTAPEQYDQKEESVAREDLISALDTLSKESVWRVKGFVRLKGDGVHILNWAFGRFDLTRLLEPPDAEETIRLTVMGERGEVLRGVRRLCAKLPSSSFQTMFSYALSTASTYFYLPIDEEQDADIESYERKYLTWVAEPSGSSTAALPPSSPHKNSASDHDKAKIVRQILEINNLYDILGVEKSPTLDRMTLRRAYLSRSRACHPDKFPDNPDATYAFQKVAVAYDVLSKPSSRRLYDSRSSSAHFDVFATRPTNHAEETFRGVVLGVFNDFLDGDLEVIRTLLRAINDINPSIKLGDEGIDSVVATLEAIRERALTCRTCIYALHAELTRLLEVQHAFRQLSYFDIMGRSRLTIQLTRITLSLPIALERALREQNYADDTKPTPVLFPRHVTLLIRGVDVVLDRMERILK